MLELENKPKNAEEAIKAGWKTAKEMYTTCETSRQTWENFVADIRKSISQKPNSSCAIDCITKNCITGAHNTKYYHPKVEEAFQLWLRRNAINAGGQRTEGSIIKQEIHDIVDNSGYKYTKEGICSICNVDEKTFRRFFEEARLDTTVQPKIITERDFISIGSSHKKLYTEQVLQKFQLWLKKNAMNAGGQRTEGSIIKQDNQKDLFIGCIATKGTPAEIRSLADHLMEMANQKELLEQTNQQNQQLQLENQTMKSTLQYDKVKGWYRWGDLKRQWKPHCDRLKKSNYETIFYEAGLEYGKDYEEIVFSGCEFPTCMVSPTAVPKLISYLHIL